MSNLDTAKFRKVHALMIGGSTDGERKAARAAATKMARKAGMTLLDAVVASDQTSVPPAKAAASIFEEFFNSPEFQAKRTERNAREAVERAAILDEYGSEEAVFALTDRERQLLNAVTPIAEFGKHTDDTGNVWTYTKSLDGVSPMFWDEGTITPAVRDAVLGAYPLPDALGEALAEYRSWQKLRHIRSRVAGGEYNHYHEVEARLFFVEELLNRKPVLSWDDMDARLEWWQVELDWQSSSPIKKQQAFKDRVAADLGFLRAMEDNATKSGSPEKTEQGDDAAQSGRAQNGRRTNADKAADVCELLLSQPSLSDREIGRRAGVSPQTVSNWRKRLSSPTQRRAA